MRWLSEAFGFHMRRRRRRRRRRRSGSHEVKRQKQQGEARKALGFPCVHCDVGTV